MRVRHVFLVILFTAAALGTVDFVAQKPWGMVIKSPRGSRTLKGVIKKLGPALRPKLEKTFKEVGLEYPPDRLTYLVFKDAGRFEVWGRSESGTWGQVSNYKILGASGGLGPKLKQGDKQVPEGVYALTVFNPNSRFHLSMGLNYPNMFDRTMARQDGRTSLGGDIFIHGSFVSIGCLAMGDTAIEELFLLTHDVGLARTRVVIVPHDFRKGELPEKRFKVKPAWRKVLYDRLRAELSRYPAAEP